MIHVDTIPIFPRHFGTAKSHVHLHVEMNRTSTCHHSSVFLRRQLPHSVGANHVELSRRCVASCRTLVVDLSAADTGTIFNKPETSSSRRHSKNTRTHSSPDPRFTLSVYGVASNVCNSVSED